MDCFPGYVKGDYAHKVFFKTMISGKDVYDSQETDVVECPDLDIALTAVNPGASAFTEQNYLGKDLNTLGSDFAATVDRASVDFTGRLNYIPEWTEFSNLASDQTGYFYPYQLKAENGAKLTFPGSLGGKGKTLVFGETGDGDGTINLVGAVNSNAPVITAKLESADGTKSTEYSFDFSRCDFG